MAAGDWKDLLNAIFANDLALVKYHVEGGVNVNYQHPEFLTTPLLESITQERLEITKYLLEQGADPTLRAGFSADSPLKVARRTGNKALISLVKSFLPKKRSSLKWIIQQFKGS
ncbi:ankyrin repeat domain-containing protein [Lewinella sp. W8]|uniref:ankyrin repeat domain-containing protein n=1 Tax=Lewinella sp. W8 TaxID=2528208 RepID=UPI001067DD92|nr:ankyrin repeat domain-containing protein [Lewinella sp. W8]MTB51952.1 ankyrin repeat domain-containing protein [Lewinella sp. W8]